MSARRDRLRGWLLELEPPRSDDASLEVLRDERVDLEDAGLAREVVERGLRAKNALLAADLEGRADEALDDDLDALEAIVDVTRPVVDVAGGTFEIPQGDFAALNRYRKAIDGAIAATGRVEVAGQAQFVGTAFLVAPRLVMTNRHVAVAFAGGVGLSIALRGAASIDLAREASSTSDGPTMKVRAIAMIHPHWDMALLEVDDDHGRAPLALHDRPAERGSDIVVVGYPFWDRRSAEADLQTIFRRVFGVKRVLPGRLGGTSTYASFGREVRVVKHDASTLGGSSGSPVFEPEAGAVVALHFAGDFGKRNVGVPSWDLLRDARVCRAIGRPAPTGEPLAEVAAAWDALAPAKAVAAPTSAGAVEAGDTIARARDWYERVAEDTLADMLLRDRGRTLTLLGEAVGPEEASDIAAQLAPGGEGLFSRAKLDPNLPEIVLLHGIMGGHLESVGTFRERIWLSPVSLLLSNVAERLRLAADGTTDREPELHIQPAGPIRFFYGKAARSWRERGFAVHEWGFDWRKSLRLSAERLALFLQTLALDRPGRTFAIVAHSMGGLVAALAAAQSPAMLERVQRTVFLGAPLGGSFAPMEAVLGSYPFLVKLAYWAPNIELGDLCQLSLSLPGLLEMLPNPSLFSGCARLYQAGAWPESSRPSQVWLDRSRNLKQEFLASPLLARASLLVALDRPTVSGLAADRGFAAGERLFPGDGTVPARAALVPGVPAYEVHADHSMLLRDDQAIAAVADLLRLGDAAGRVADDFDAGAPLGTEAPRAAELPARPGPESLLPRGRELTARDLEWLFSAGIGPPPR